jgi:F-type H+-transporting ATPase subunit b
MVKRNPRLERGSSTTSILGVVVGIVLFIVGITVLKDVEPELLQGIDMNVGKLVSMIGIVLVLLPVINSLYVKPLRLAIDERNSDLERTFSEAEELRARMETMRTDYERRLQDTEAQAREQIQAQIREAQTLRTTLMAEASQRADEMISRAQQEIESEKQKAIAEIRTQVVDLTLTAAERVLGENMDNERNRRLVSEFIDKVEVPA